jgi:hypothetical protein
MEWEKKVLGDRKLERGVNFLYFSSPPPPSKMREKLNGALSDACFTCLLLGHVFRPYMVLHKTMQHGSTCSFSSAKELSNVLSIFVWITVFGIYISQV